MISHVPCQKTVTESHDQLRMRKAASPSAPNDYVDSSHPVGDEDGSGSEGGQGYLRSVAAMDGNEIQEVGVSNGCDQLEHRKETFTVRFRAS